MKIKYANKFVQKLGMGDPTTWFYQFINDENDSDETKIVQFFNMHGLGLCIKVDSCVTHMFYVWPWSHNTPVPIAINKNKYFLSLNTNTTVFSWGSSNPNKNTT